MHVSLVTIETSSLITQNKVCIIKSASVISSSYWLILYADWFAEDAISIHGTSNQSVSLFRHWAVFIHPGTYWLITSMFCFIQQIADYFAQICILYKDVRNYGNIRPYPFWTSLNNKEPEKGPPSVERVAVLHYDYIIQTNASRLESCSPVMTSSAPYS